MGKLCAGKLVATVLILVWYPLLWLLGSLSFTPEAVATGVIPLGAWGTIMDRQVVKSSASKHDLDSTVRIMVEIPPTSV